MCACGRRHQVVRQRQADLPSRLEPGGCLLAAQPLLVGGPGRQGRARTEAGHLALLGRARVRATGGPAADGGRA